MNKKTFKDILTEDQVCEKLGVNQRALEYMRKEEGFPFLRFNRNNRLYLVSDVVEWLESRRVTNSG